MPHQKRTFRGVPVGKKRIDGVIVPVQEIKLDDDVSCSECQSINLEDISFVRQHGYFQNVCISVLHCSDCGNVMCLMWAEEYQV